MPSPLRNSNLKQKIQENPLKTSKSSKEASTLRKTSLKGKETPPTSNKQASIPFNHTSNRTKPPLQKQKLSTHPSANKPATITVPPTEASLASLNQSTGSSSSNEVYFKKVWAPELDAKSVASSKNSSGGSSRGNSQPTSSTLGRSSHGKTVSSRFRMDPKSHSTILSNNQKNESAKGTRSLLRKEPRPSVESYTSSVLSLKSLESQSSRHRTGTHA
eukprot:Sdes_comp15500_c0_seq1m4434